MTRYIQGEEPGVFDYVDDNGNVVEYAIVTMEASMGVLGGDFDAKSLLAMKKQRSGQNFTLKDAYSRSDTPL